MDTRVPVNPWTTLLIHSPINHAALFPFWQWRILQIQGMDTLLCFCSMLTHNTDSCTTIDLDIMHMHWPAQPCFHKLVLDFCFGRTMLPILFWTISLCLLPCILYCGDCEFWWMGDWQTVTGALPWALVSGMPCWLVRDSSNRLFCKHLDANPISTLQLLKDTNWGNSPLHFGQSYLHVLWAVDQVLQIICHVPGKSLALPTKLFSRS